MGTSPPTTIQNQSIYPKIVTKRLISLDYFIPKIISINIAYARGGGGGKILLIHQFQMRYK